MCTPRQVFAWTTVNFLLHNLDKGHGASTVGIMDLGGGSTQIVYEVRVPFTSVTRN